MQICEKINSNLKKEVRLKKTLPMYHCSGERVQKGIVYWDKQWDVVPVSWLSKTTKSLFIFLFLLDLLHKKECGKVSCHKCHKCHSHIMSHNECVKVVYRLYSSCISSIENLIETPLSSSY